MRYKALGAIAIWIVFSLIPMGAALTTFIKSGTNDVTRYRACVMENRKFLPLEESAMCCIPLTLHELAVHPERRILSMSNEALVFLSHYRTSALVFLLFLTPSLLYLFAFLSKDGIFSDAGKITLSVTYLLIFICFAIGVLTFKDS